MINLIAADENRGSHREGLQGSCSLMRHCPEELLEIEELGGIGRGFLGCVCVILCEGVTLELVVPVLGGQRKSGQHCCHDCY